MRLLTKAGLAFGAFALALVAIALAVGRLGSAQSVPAETAPEAASAPAETTVPATETQGFLYGRITTVDDTTYEGRLRWGGGEEAFWGDYFNGIKKENPWVAQLPRVPGSKQRHAIKIFGFQFGADHESSFDRPFMARFGDITRIERDGKTVRVTLKSGAAYDLDRFEAGDFDDGLRVWDGTRGVVDLDSLQIRSIELMPTRALGDAPQRLHGTVHTRQGEFTGFLQWDRTLCLDTDELHGLRLGTIGSIERRSDDRIAVTLLDGRENELSIGDGNRGIYVDDPRYGRVLISWDAFERVEFSPGGGGPAYGDFPAGGPLRGSVTTRDGNRFTGRLVYDLDESDTVETLDAPSNGVDYTIPFGSIAAIVPPSATVTLHSGETLTLELAGDLGAGNAGMLIFADDREQPDYVPWADVARVDFERPRSAR